MTKYTVVIGLLKYSKLKWTKKQRQKFHFKLFKRLGVRPYYVLIYIIFNFFLNYHISYEIMFVLLYFNIVFNLVFIYNFNLIYSFYFLKVI